eukprot:327472-Alexandrium_andersonii.AAC.1
MKPSPLLYQGSPSPIQPFASLVLPACSALDCFSPAPFQPCVGLLSTRRFAHLAFASPCPQNTPSHEACARGHFTPTRTHADTTHSHAHMHEV